MSYQSFQTTGEYLQPESPPSERITLRIRKALTEKIRAMLPKEIPYKKDLVVAEASDPDTVTIRLREELGRLLLGNVSLAYIQGSPSFLKGILSLEDEIFVKTLLIDLIEKKVYETKDFPQDTERENIRKKQSEKIVEEFHASEGLHALFDPKHPKKYWEKIEKHIILKYYPQRVMVRPVSLEESHSTAQKVEQLRVNLYKDEKTGNTPIGTIQAEYSEETGMYRIVFKKTVRDWKYGPVEQIFQFSGKIKNFEILW